LYHGLTHFFNYDNFSRQKHNTCGQAVIATLLDHSGKDPYQIERTLYSAVDSKLHLPENVLAEVVRDFGPNWPIRNAVTVRSQIKRALDTYGIAYREVVHKPFRSAATSRESLEAHLRNGQPVVVLIDTYSLKLGRRFTLHWAIAFGYDDEMVSLATWGKEIKIHWTDFMRAWRCWFVTYPYNYYQIQVTL
jgi:hypothetical protein